MPVDPKRIAIFVVLCLFGMVNLLASYYVFTPDALIQVDEISGTIVEAKVDIYTPMHFYICVFPNYKPSSNFSYYDHIYAVCDRSWILVPDRLGLTEPVMMDRMVRITYIRSSRVALTVEFAV